MKKEKDGYTEYRFKDTDINWDQVCFDAFKDSAPAFLVIGEDCAYYGVLSDCLYTSPLGHPYVVYNVPRESIPQAISLLKETTQNYKRWRDAVNTNIKDRSREKEDNWFRVLQF